VNVSRGCERAGERGGSEREDARAVPARVGEDALGHLAVPVARASQLMLTVPSSNECLSLDEEGAAPEKKRGRDVPVELVRTSAALRPLKGRRPPRARLAALLPLEAVQEAPHAEVQRRARPELGRGERARLDERGRLARGELVDVAEEEDRAWFGRVGRVRRAEEVRHGAAEGDLLLERRLALVERGAREGAVRDLGAVGLEARVGVEGRGEDARLEEAGEGAVRLEDEEARDDGRQLVQADEE